MAHLLPKLRRPDDLNPPWLPTNFCHPAAQVTFDALLHRNETFSRRCTNKPFGSLYNGCRFSRPKSTFLGSQFAFRLLHDAGDTLKLP
jgi:hypothetical protein